MWLTCQEIDQDLPIMIKIVLVFQSYDRLGALIDF